MYPFVYTILKYDEFIEKETYESGIGFCNTWAEAAEKIAEYYKDELISIVRLTLLNSSELITLPSKIVNDIEKDLYLTWNESQNLTEYPSFKE